MSRRRNARIAKALGVTVISPLALFGIDAAVTLALEPNIAPGVTRISTEEQCKSADAVYFIISSMGPPTAQHTANNVREIVEQHNGCVMATSYGTSYNGETQAILNDEMLKAVRAVTLPGGKAKKVIMHTQSFGIFAGRAALMSDEFRAAEEAGEINKAALIAESSPSGKESIKDPLARTMIDLSQHGVRIGKGALWLFDVMSAAKNGDNMLSGKTWDDLSAKTAETSPRLVGDQLKYIADGLADGATNVPIYYFGSKDDQVVSVDVAKNNIQAKENTEVAFHQIKTLPGSYNHAGGWLRTEYEEAGYEDGIKEVLNEVLPVSKNP